MRGNAQIHAPLLGRLASSRPETREHGCHMEGLTVELHLEPLFKAYLGGIGGVDRGVAGAQELASLLRQLDVPGDLAAVGCIAKVDGATERAVATITDWMSYLPKNCVRAMVRDGWHWST